MRVAWVSGVSIEHNNVKIILDPQNDHLGHSPVFITHGHFDHSAAFRENHASKYSSKETAELILSYGLETGNWQPLTVNNKVAIDDIEVIPHNSGHVLGSYEFEIQTPKGSILYTGDFNTENTKTMKPAESVQCDILILESTFGSPHFVFPTEDQIAKDMVEWAKMIIKAGRIPTFQTDPLGNAQEVIKIFNEASIPVLTHWKVSRINRVYESFGYKLDYLDSKAIEADEVISTGNFIYITPKQLDLQNHPEFIPALVSGWALWSKHKAFPLSDHADFPRLVKFVEKCNPKIVLTCHSERFNESLTRYIESKLKIRAFPIELIPTNLCNND